MCCVSCLGVWWRHNIWISEKLKFDSLKNEKSFRSKKTFILVQQVRSFTRTKQTSQNVPDKTFKQNVRESIAARCIYNKRKSKKSNVDVSGIKHIMKYVTWDLTRENLIPEKKFTAFYGFLSFELSCVNFELSW